MRKFIKNLFSGAVVVIAVRVGVHLSQSAAEPGAAPGSVTTHATTSNQINDTLTNSELQAIVSIANKRYPRVTTPGVRIERMTAGDQILIYHKTILEISASEFDMSALAAAQPQLIAEACQSTLIDFLSKGISVQNRFSDVHGVLIHEYTVGPADCEK